MLSAEPLLLEGLHDLANTDYSCVTNADLTGTIWSLESHLNGMSFRQIGVVALPNLDILRSRVAKVQG
jgi:hypothetical protein